MSMPRNLRNRRHGHTSHGVSSPEYRAWNGMRTRCYNAGHQAHRYYADRDIQVCARWRESFEAFLSDVGLRPSASHTLDRIDNDGHYEPGNVRWATRIEQAQNKRTNVLFTYKGETRCARAWERLYGLPNQTLARRLGAGWSLADALGTPVGARA